MGEWENDWHFFLDYEHEREHRGMSNGEPETVTLVEMTGETVKAIEIQPIDGNGFPAWVPRSRITTNLKKIGDQGYVTMPVWLFHAKVQDGFDWFQRLWWNGKDRRP